MEPRKKDSYQKFADDFIKMDILVVCPNCSQKAIVKPSNFSYTNVEQCDIKIICPKCGYNKKLVEKPASIINYTKFEVTTDRYYIVGREIDPFFHLPLWLKTDFEGHTFWAYNIEHLEFLQGHIEAKLRERNGQELFNRSMGSRLPKWMTSKKNREALLKKINELKIK